MRKSIVSQLKYYYDPVHAIGTLYQDGTSAIQLVDAANGSPVAKASVNMRNTIDDTEYSAIPQDNVFIKDYAENTGVVKTLVDAGIIALPKRKYTLSAGYNTVTLYKIIDTDVLSDIADTQERVNV